MKIKVFATMLGATLIGVSCQSNSNSGSSTEQDSTAVDSLAETPYQGGVEIPFTEAQRYFVNNTYNNTEIDELKIDTQEEFDRIFGMAAVMGEDGTPTSIDFAKEYVLAIIGKVTDKKTVIKADHLWQQGADIVLDYHIEEGDKLSYTLHPSLLVVVNRQYAGNTVFKRR